MDRCLDRPLALRAVVAAAVVLVVSQFALQSRDGVVEPSAWQSSPGRFVPDAFPTAEAGVLAEAMMGATR